MSLFDKFWPRWITRTKYALTNWFVGNFYAGPGDEWPGCPSFLVVCENINTSDDDYLWAGTGKTMVRGLIVGDKGDACDLILRRAGPDNSKYNDSAVSSVKDGEVIGTLYWQALGKDKNGGLYWTPRDGHEGRLVTFRVRAVGEQTATNRAGRLQIGVTEPNKVDPTDRLEITAEGKLRYNFPGKGWRTISIDTKGFLKAT